MTTIGRFASLCLRLASYFGYVHSTHTTISFYLKKRKYRNGWSITCKKGNTRSLKHACSWIVTFVTFDRYIAAKITSVEMHIYLNGQPLSCPQNSKVITLKRYKAIVSITFWSLHVFRASKIYVKLWCTAKISHFSTIVIFTLIIRAL